MYNMILILMEWFLCPQMCEINESPLFLKLNPLAKTNDVGFMFISLCLKLYKKNLWKTLFFSVSYLAFQIHVI